MRLGVEEIASHQPAAPDRRRLEQRREEEAERRDEPEQPDEESTR